MKTSNSSRTLKGGVMAFQRARIRDTLVIDETMRMQESEIIIQRGTYLE